jgi:hypothetical protein
MSIQATFDFGQARCTLFGCKSEKSHWAPRIAPCAGGGGVEMRVQERVLFPDASLRRQLLRSALTDVQ